MVHTYAGATAVVVALAWYSRHSAVRLLEAGRVARYPWVPWWGALLAWLSPSVCWRRRPELPAGGCGAAHGAGRDRVRIVYLVTSPMAGQIGPIQGFDDMQSVTGADLLSRGFFPWSDFLFIHGLFEDALRSPAGFFLFGHSLWATHAALGLIWIPFTWVGVYWVGVWASPAVLHHSWRSVVLLVWASAHFRPSWRWVGMSLVWVLLGEAVRRNGWRWTALLTAVLFVEAVLVPEASLQVIAATSSWSGATWCTRGTGRSLAGTRPHPGLRRRRCRLHAGVVYRLGHAGRSGCVLGLLRGLRPWPRRVRGAAHPDLADSVFITCFLACVVAAAVTFG